MTFCSKTPFQRVKKSFLQSFFASLPGSIVLDYYFPVHIVIFFVAINPTIIKNMIILSFEMST